MTDNLWTGHREGEFHGIIAVTRDDATRAALFDADRMEWLRIEGGKLFPATDSREAESVFEGVEYDGFDWDGWDLATHLEAIGRGYKLGAWVDDGDEFVAQVMNWSEKDMVGWFR